MDGGCDTFQIFSENIILRDGESGRNPILDQYLYVVKTLLLHFWGVFMMLYVILNNCMILSDCMIQSNCMTLSNCTMSSDCMMISSVLVS